MDRDSPDLSPHLATLLTDAELYAPKSFTRFVPILPKLTHMYIYTVLWHYTSKNLPSWASQNQNQQQHQHLRRPARKQACRLDMQKSTTR